MKQQLFAGDLHFIIRHNILTSWSLVCVFSFVALFVPFGAEMYMYQQKMEDSHRI